MLELISGMRRGSVNRPSMEEPGWGAEVSGRHAKQARVSGSSADPPNGCSWPAYRRW